MGSWITPGEREDSAEREHSVLQPILWVVLESARIPVCLQRGIFREERVILSILLRTCKQESSVQLWP